MKKSLFLILVVLSVILLAACSSQGTPEDSSSDSAASTGAVKAGGANVADKVYESAQGWTVRYEPSLIKVEEKKDSVRFLYTGEAVGENYVEISYFAGRQPREVLGEQLEGADEDSVTRDEGYFYEDKWGFTAEVETSEDDRDVTTSYQAAEYNDGVILTKMVEGLTDENILEGYMGDILWGILDTITFYSYPPQKEFAYVPGTYNKKEANDDGPDQIILKEDHSGKLLSKKEIPVIWGSYQFTEKNTENTYEYTIEGESLLLNIDDKWIEYDKAEDKAGASGVNPWTDPDTVKELNKEINTLYNDASGDIGRIHKMQAFIMELALHAKTKNPDFKVITQNAVFLAYKDGKFENGDQESMRDLVDGWSVEGVVGKGSSLEPNIFQKMYIDQVKKGKYVSDTTTVRTQEELDNYLARANAWGINPYPKLGGDLARELLPGKRWADNLDYFWVEDPKMLGISDRIDGKRDVKNLSDAKTFLYNINSRPYDNWQDWDKEEKEFEKGDGDRTRITDSYACGLLVPSEKGTYTPVGEDEEDEDVAEIVKTYGDHWDWWWREAGLDEKSGREAWLDALRNSDYDVIYIDSFYNHRARPENQTPLTKEEVESLKIKPDGGRRQVISYLAIGTAEQNRWYCQDDWIWVDPSNKNSYYSMKAGKVIERGTNAIYIPFKDSEAAKKAGDTKEPPTWLAFGYGDEYPEEAVVQWWTKDWRDIIINGNGKYAHKVTGDKTSSIDRIMDQGFDGVYLDNADSCTDSFWLAFEEYWGEHKE